MIFMSLVDFLQEKRIEVPRYFVLAKIITEALKEHEGALLASLEEKMMPQNKRQNHNLIDKLYQLR